MTMLDLTEKFRELFSELEHCNKEEQKQKIEEMNRLMEEMDREEFKSVFNSGLFDALDEMIDEMKISLKNVCILLKHLGYCTALKNIWVEGFYESLLLWSFREMVLFEDQKKDGRNEKLLVDLCECRLLLNNGFSSELLTICTYYLLKAASNKEENEEARKEVEMALLALSCIRECDDTNPKLNLEKIKEIIHYHQEHHNLTKLAYQSTWQFLIFQLKYNQSLNEVIANELHFAREATRELEELMKCVDWKRTVEEKGENVSKEELILIKWLGTLGNYFLDCKLWNEEFVGLVRIIAQVLRSSKDLHRDIRKPFMRAFASAADNEAIKVEDLIESGADDIAMDEIQRPTMDDETVHLSVKFFDNISKRLKEVEEEEEGEEIDKMEEKKRKATKMEIFEKMEEEGYEDITTSFKERLKFVNDEFSNYYELPSDICDFLIDAFGNEML
ncbi:uncharacterized protein MONOS_2933 [Monocercomonoides exilis]|uniref:uncharacterized protein n=1 Tax=Monocercomonoides exilis TaxID=2049356 RepID=UPI00355A34FA|nr:hypothetical protein MONOS_2933 [Monocercomonoides exilis]|eukprot:MONOS_2933.1-p1 / transcript=MONOS_2933.1 / gene=MONOS_2933 / organism=Monocercomonoides_exilis_PA203 / gene_product=unspecified product / transcript_product=unspecified product / location=Mono_scaffold00064:78761-80357(-) / protein_length=446 / sequence_SO=supercontig / SO=protein_coding / is_pseudo=false